jgi:tetratricopeptide (TPR) repeat protein
MKNRAQLIFFFLTIAAFCLASYGFSREMSTEEKAQFGLAQSFNNTGQFEKAQPILKSLYVNYPGDKDVTHEMLKAFGYAGRVSVVRDLIDRLEKENPDNVELFSMTASIFEANNDVLEAQKRYKKLLALKKTDNEDIIVKLVDAAITMRDYEQAWHWYAQIQNKALLDENSWKLRKAGILFGRKQWGQAAGVYSDIPPEQLPEYQLRHFIEALEKSGNRVKAQAILDKIYLTNPGQSIQFMDIYLWMGDEQKASAIIERVLNSDQSTEDQLRQITDALLSQKDHKKMMASLQEILHKYPSNKYALLQMARVLSWERRYKESLRYYDGLIAQYPDWIELQREKARLYGWMNDYTKALSVYRSIETGSKDDVVNDEYLAKKYFYRGYDRHAVAYYKAWIEKEPNNPEAIFDLAQIYSQLRLWDEAQKLYDRLLDLYPDHYMGKQSEEALHRLRDEWQVSSSWEMFESGSTSRMNDVRYNMVSAQAQKSLSAMWDLDVNTENYWYNFADIHGLYRNSSGMGLGFYPNSDLSMRMNYERVEFSDGVSPMNSWEGQVKYQKDGYLSSFDFKTDPYIQNTETLKSGLKDDTYKFDEEVPLTDRWSAGILYSLDEFSDSNAQQTYAGQTAFKIIEDPNLLLVRYQYEAYGFSHPTEEYFSPHDFHSHEWSIQWRQYLNKDGFFWGSRDVYYDLLYGFDMDVHTQKAHRGEIKWHQDITNRWAWEINWDIKRYEHADIYHEQQLSIKGIYYF